MRQPRYAPICSGISIEQEGMNADQVRSYLRSSCIAPCLEPRAGWLAKSRVLGRVALPREARTTGTVGDRPDRTTSHLKGAGVALMLMLIGLPDLQEADTEADEGVVLQEPGRRVDIRSLDHCPAVQRSGGRSVLGTFG